MSNPIDREVAVFGAARRLPAGERAAYLSEVCAGDAELRLRIEQLLRASDEAEGFLQDPAPGAQRPMDASTPQEPLQITAVPGEKAGDRIGRYKLLQQIGEGGCGVVYMAEQEEPVRRRVALKVIKLGMDTKQVIARFEAERQALALMDHPNIAKVLEAGATDAGRPYFVMELVRGTKITEYCDQNNLSTKERLELFIHVCHAVQHAHQKGIIHRDIKPSNILVASNDGSPVPKVIDFGIAKATQGRLTNQTLFTAFEQFIGTPAYMSPEQAELTMFDVDTRTDIYSLGVLLYELLIGRTPFDTNDLLAAGLDAMRRTIREQEPQRPSTRLSTMAVDALTMTAKHRQTEAPRLLHLIRGDLDWIVMKALEKDRARRYETANGLAMDIQRHLNNEPVVACPPSSLYRFQKSVLRNKVVFASASVVVATLTIGFGVSTWLLVEEKRALRSATQAEARAKQAHQETTEQLYESYVAQARANRLSRQPGRYFNTIETIAKAVAIRPSPELRNEAIAALALVDVRMTTIGQMNSGDTEFVCFDPTLEVYAQTTREGDITVRRVRDDQEVGLLPTRGMGVRWLHGFSHDGRFLAFDTSKLDLCAWDLLEQRMAFQNLALPPVGGMVFSATENSFVSADPDGSLSSYELESGKVTRPPAKISPGSTAMAIDRNGSRLAGLNNTTCLAEIVNLKNGDVVATMKVPAGCHALAFSDDGKLLAAACSDGHAYIWGATSGDLLRTCVGHGGEVIRLAFNHAGTLLATTSFDDTVRLWDPFSGAELLSFRGSSWQIQFSPDDNRLAFVPHGTKFGLLEVANHPEYQCWSSVHKSGGALNVTISLDNRLAATTWDGVRFWDFATGREIGFLPEPGLVSALFDPDGRNLITCGLAGLKRWPIRATTETSVDEFQIGTDSENYGAAGSQLGFASLSADGSKIAFVHYFDRDKARVIDRAHPDKVIMLGSHPGVNHVSISPDGKWVATGTWKGSGVKVWDAENGQLVRDLPAPGSATVLFSPDGHWLVTGSIGYQLWETRTWKSGPPISLTPENVQIGVMAFSPDSQLLAIARGDHAVRLLETKTARTLADFEPPGISLIKGLCFGRSGSRLLASDGLGKVHEWNLRLIRKRLDEVKLDWDLPPYPAEDEVHRLKPVRVEVIAADPKR